MDDGDREPNVTSRGSMGSRSSSVEARVLGPLYTGLALADFRGSDSVSGRV